MSTIDKKRSTKLLILLFIVYAVCFAVPNFAQYQFSPLAKQIMEQYALDMGQFNSIFTAPMLPAIFTSIICGLMVDRYGYKPVIGLSILLTVVGCWLRVIAPGYTVLFIGMILVGFSGGFMSSNTSKVLALLYGQEKVGVLAGMVLTCSTVTLVISMSTTALLPSMKFAFILSGVVSIIALALWIVFMPHIKPKDIAAAAAEGEKAPGLGESLVAVMKTPAVWLTGIMMFCVCGTMAGTGSMIPAALQEVRGISEATAGVVGSMTMVGNLLGSLITPTICNKTGKFRPVLMILGIICAACCVFAWKASGIVLYILMIILGYCLGSGMASGLGMAVRLHGIGAKYAGTAGGFVATLQLLGGVCLPTYIASGIAGGNYNTYFIVLGVACLVWMVTVFLMPKYLDTKQ